MEQQKDNQSKSFGGMQLHQGQHKSNQGQYQKNQGQRSSSFSTPRATVNTEHQQGIKPSVPYTQEWNTKQGFAYVMRRMEKLTTALYLVTDIMSEKEPMKWKAREGVVDLLSDITIASSLSVSEKMTMLRNVMKKTEKLIAFLDVAQSAHLISEMNSSVLKREYLALKDSIEREWGQVYEKSRSLFSDTFF